MRTNFLGLRSQMNDNLLRVPRNQPTKPKKSKVVLNGFSNCIICQKNFSTFHAKQNILAILSVESDCYLQICIQSRQKTTIPCDPLCVTIIFQISQTCQHSTRSDIPTFAQRLYILSRQQRIVQECSPGIVLLYIFFYQQVIQSRYLCYTQIFFSS